MTKQPCDQISTELVDYADGLLDAKQAHHIEAHLAQCPDCTKLLKALNQTLRIAQTLWEGAGQEADRISQPPLRRSRFRHWFRIGTIAAGMAVVIGVLRWNLTSSHSPEPAPTLAQVQEQVSRSARAAQLLMATNMLSECRGTEELVQQQLNYVQEHYLDSSGILNLDTENRTH